MNHDPLPDDDVPIGDDASDDAFTRSLATGLARTADGVLVAGPTLTSVIRAHRADRRRSHRRRTGAIGTAAAIGAVVGTASLLGRDVGGPTDPVGLRTATTSAAPEGSLCTGPFSTAALRSYGPVRLDGPRVDALEDGGFIEPLVDVVDVPVFLTPAEVAHLGARGLPVDAPVPWSYRPNVHVEAIQQLDVGEASPSELRAALMAALAPNPSTSTEGEQLWHVGSLVAASDRVLGSRWRLPDGTAVSLTAAQSRAVSAGGVRLDRPDRITVADGIVARAALRLLVDGDGLTDAQVRAAVVGLDPGPDGGPSARFTDAELLDLLVWGVAPPQAITHDGDDPADPEDRGDMVFTPAQIAEIVAYIRSLEAVPEGAVEACRPIEPGD